MEGRHFGALTLHTFQGERKYLNAAERHRFLSAAEAAPVEVRLFALVLFWSGSRISEALALTASAIDVDDCIAVFQTLKRRQERRPFRQLPLPADLVRQLDETFSLRARQRDPKLAGGRLWLWSRTTAWRHIKKLMALSGVAGAAATPKGLRHGFGVAALMVSVPLHLVQRWLGHASIETTKIYGDVVGNEEREFASRIWRAGDAGVG